MKEDIPKLKISGGLLNTEKIIKQLEKLEEYVDVNFTEDGFIPDYIEFDRDNQDLYITIEEILTVYVNNKKQTDNECEEEFENIKEFPNEDIHSSKDELVHIFPLIMFKKGTVKRENLVIDIDTMLKFFMGSNKHIIFLINNYDQYYDFLLQTYSNSLKFEYSLDKFKKMHVDAICELEQTLLLIQEILTDSLFTYLDESYNKLINNVVHDDYKFDIALKFTIMKNAGEMRILDFIKEKRQLISEAVYISSPSFFIFNNLTDL